MASNTVNLNTWAAKRIFGDNQSQNPAGALLNSGAGRADNSTTGDTWIFLDTIGGTSSPWGFKHSQGDNGIKFFGGGTHRSTIWLGESKITATTFEGNASTASKWQTARTLTIGATGKSVDGSGNVSWSKDEILGASTSAYFLRGDKSWSATLANTFTSTASPGFTNSVSAGSWAYLRLNNGSNLWDIATKSDHASGALEMRIGGGDTGYYFQTSDIPEGAANLSTAAAMHAIKFYRNGFLIPYQMDNANDGGMLRVRGTSESNCILELATWDDSGSGETIQFNYYPTSSQVTPTYSMYVPKASGHILYCSYSSIAGFRNEAASNRTYYWGFNGSNAETYAVHYTNMVVGTAQSCTGNATTATHLSSASDSTKFYRGDKTWSNTLVGNMTVQGNFYIGGSNSSNFISFHGLTGDNPVQDANHFFIGNRTWASSESSELVLFAGNDVGDGNSATTVSGSGPDRIRHIAAAHVFQTYTSALSGTFEAVSTSSALATKFEINTNNLISYRRMILEENNSWLSPARLQLLRPDTTAYSNRAVIGVTNGNLHLDAYNGYAIYLNHYCPSGNIYFGNAGYCIWNQGANYNGTAAGCSGNAASATQLQTARSIWGQSFNGTANIDGTLVQTSGNLNGETTSNTNHAIKIGHSGDDVCIFYEFGGLWRFYTSQSNSNTQRAYIDSQGVHNAVWNDFAEYRKSSCKEPGRVVIDDGKGCLHLCNIRLAAGARIISDTFGCSVGISLEQDTPIGVGGRVLAYPYQDRNNYHVGDAVCSAPEGTIDIMTRDEIIMYPERILGIVSEVPEYEEWRQIPPDSSEGVSEGVEVKGRIWIYVR